MPSPLLSSEGTPGGELWGFLRRALLGSGEEAAVCTGPSELSRLWQLGHPSGTKLPPWLPSLEPVGNLTHFAGGHWG